MKYYELVECVRFLQNFKTINSISRAEENTLRFHFGKDATVYASLKRGSSGFFMSDSFRIAKNYFAPFDNVLAKRFSNSFVECLELSPNDRVVSIKVTQKNSYKTTASCLVLEFTGRNTNAIVLDEEDKVAEALRHIDKDLSYRVVKVGEKLVSLPPYGYKEKIEPITDIRAFLFAEYQKKQEDVLQALKSSKRAYLQKKIDKARSLLETLESEDEMKQTAEEMNQKGILLLSCRHLLNDCDEERELEDFAGKKHKIFIGKMGVQAAIDEFFNKSKKLKQKAKSAHKERENLTQKIEFLVNLDRMISIAKTADEIEILLPKINTDRKKEEFNGAYMVFFMENYKIMVGKNEKGNAEILRAAKKNDIWFHLKDIPSAHVVLKTDKRNISQNVVKFCAEICVNFSGVNSGAYDVDYTQRRNVKVAEGSRVNYVDFNTIRVQR